MDWNILDAALKHQQPSSLVLVLLLLQIPLWGQDIPDTQSWIPEMLDPKMTVC